MNFSDDDLLGLWRAVSYSVWHLEGVLSGCKQQRISDELSACVRLQDLVMAEIVLRNLDVCRTPEWSEIFGGRI